MIQPHGVRQLRGRATSASSLGEERASSPSAFDQLAGLGRTELVNLAARATTNQQAADPLLLGDLLHAL